jgi:hypothetical protein
MRLKVMALSLIALSICTHAFASATVRSSNPQERSFLKVILKDQNGNEVDRSQARYVIFEVCESAQSALCDSREVGTYKYSDVQILADTLEERLDSIAGAVARGIMKSGSPSTGPVAPSGGTIGFVSGAYYGYRARASQVDVINALRAKSFQVPSSHVLIENLKAALETGEIPFGF